MGFVGDGSGFIWVGSALRWWGSRVVGGALFRQALSHVPEPEPDFMFDPRLGTSVVAMQQDSPN